MNLWDKNSTQTLSRLCDEFPIVLYSKMTERRRHSSCFGPILCCERMNGSPAVVGCGQPETDLLEVRTLTLTRLFDCSAVSVLSFDCVISLFREMSMPCRFRKTVCRLLNSAVSATCWLLSCVPTPGSSK